MTWEPCESLSRDRLGNTEIAAWLLDHPEFFVEHEWLLEHLSIPHDCGEAVSLIERQVALLRQTNQELCRQIERLVHVARFNDALLGHMHALTLALLQTDEVVDILATVETALRERFGVEWVTFRVLTAREAACQAEVFADPQEAVAFAALQRHREVYVGPPDERELSLLFPEQTAIRSWALVPFDQPLFQGVLALGSRDANRFHPDLGRVFLTRLGELIGTRLNALLQTRVAP